jgi:hypothetical protein
VQRQAARVATRPDQHEAQLVDGDLDVLDLVEAEAEPARPARCGEPGDAQELRRGGQHEPHLLTVDLDHPCLPFAR